MCSVCAQIAASPNALYTATEQPLGFGGDGLVLHPLLANDAFYSVTVITQVSVPGS